MFPSAEKKHINPLTIMLYIKQEIYTTYTCLSLLIFSVNWFKTNVFKAYSGLTGKTCKRGTIRSDSVTVAVFAQLFVTPLYRERPFNLYVIVGLEGIFFFYFYRQIL